MRTDELRAGLEQLANEMEPFEADLLGVHRAVRRRRAVLSAAAAIVALVVLSGAVATLSGRGNGRVLIASPKDVEPLSQLHRIDVVVVPANRAVQEVLDASPLVGRYALVPRGSTSRWDNFTQRAAPVSCALRTSEGIAIEAANGGDITQGLQRALGNRATVYDLSYGNEADVEIFMKPNATDAQVADVRNNLQRLPSVESVRFLDHNAAYEEVKRIFADQPALVQSTTAATVPESFRLQIPDKRAAALIGPLAQSWPGVDTTISRTTQASILVASQLVAGSVYAADVIMKPDATAEQVDAMRQTLAADPAVKDVRYVSRQEASTLFQQELKDQPALRLSARDDEFSDSFLVNLRDANTTPSWLLAHSDAPGVDAIIPKSNAAPERCPK